MDVSVIIPVRNRPVVLERAIKSVQSQTSPVAEIIVVDDASTDDTVSVINRLSAKDSRIKLIEQPVRGGAGAARNVGVNAASAQYVAFLDSDDEWMIDKIERQIERLREVRGAVASFTSQIISRNGKHSQYLVSSEVSLNDLLMANVLSTTSSAMVNRQVLRGAGGFDETLPSCQDWDLWIRLRQLGSFAIVCDPMVVFYQDKGERISHNIDAVLTGHEIVFERTESVAHGLINRRRLKSAHMFRMAQIFFQEIPIFRNSRGYAIKSVAYFPNKRAVKILFKIILLDLWKFFATEKKNQA